MRYVVRKRIRSNLEQIVTVVYLHINLFRMHERVLATEMKLDILTQMAVEHVLAQKSNESASWTAQVANINEYVSVKAVETFQGFCLDFKKSYLP